MTDQRIRDSFANQGLMTTLGATLSHVAAGEVHISAPLQAATSQQHGAGHAGLTFALADTAAGYAALTLMEAGREVMTVEAKINLMAPAIGEVLIARGKVIRAGRRLTVVQAEVFAIKGDTETCIAILQGTMIPVDPA
ncbi:PaaI family thioesterase [Pseudorhodobacter turbinis]|uniref:PaaI family thioesterase n=1 Tax=Pseudorhodobacter turbinis TaxID=2500533 RepID=A0A4P8EEK2_9RHOB|nr:PaaI family thioesterase [Pseudorhodobacter turbinis]QCO55177.1 PaaI family thioesterase [Pseudorhodobacter turbinis]